MLYDRPNPSAKYLNNFYFTDAFEDNRENHEKFNTEDEHIEPEIIVRSYTICHPGTMMVVNTDTSSANLAMPWPLWFDQLNRKWGTMH